MLRRNIGDAAIARIARALRTSRQFVAPLLQPSSSFLLRLQVWNHSLATFDLCCTEAISCVETSLLATCQVMHRKASVIEIAPKSREIRRSAHPKFDRKP